MRWRDLFFMACFAFCSAAAAAAAETLIVNVSGVKAGEGDVRLGVFSSADEFPEGEYFKGVTVAGDADPIRIEVVDLPPGFYAVSVYQDFNGNKKIDKNAFGKPKEPYGFGGKWKRGRASFDDATIEVKPGGTEISIVMK